MQWNEQETYIKYKSSLTSIRNILGIGIPDIYMRPELAYYITMIYSYINKRLIMLGENQELKTYIQEVFDIFLEGADRIVMCDALGLAVECGIDTSEEVEESDCWTSAPYCQDRFVFCWSNILTTLYIILSNTYASLLAQEQEDCCCCGGNNCCRVVNPCNELDGWSSGIYPEDENKEWNSFTETIKVGWKVNGSYIDQCTNCNRR